MTAIVQNSRDQIHRICQDSGITYLALFGSQARGEQRSDSDVDLLVEFRETPGLVSFIHTKQQLEEVFGRKVDLVTKNGLSVYLKPYIQKDLQVIYE